MVGFHGWPVAALRIQLRRLDTSCATQLSIGVLERSELHRNPHRIIMTMFLMFELKISRATRVTTSVVVVVKKRQLSALSSLGCGPAALTLMQTVAKPGVPLLSLESGSARALSGLL